MMLSVFESNIAVVNSTVTGVVFLWLQNFTDKKTVGKIINLTAREQEKHR